MNLRFMGFKGGLFVANTVVGGECFSSNAGNLPRLVSGVNC